MAFKSTFHLVQLGDGISLDLNVNSIEFCADNFGRYFAVDVTDHFGLAANERRVDLLLGFLHL